MKREKKYITGYFVDEDHLKEAIVSLRENKITIADVHTPFPVHGLDHKMGLKKSRIPTVGFIAGGFGAIAAFSFQAWVFTQAYPINYGGKPFFSAPTFIPVTFEVTVLFAAFAMVFYFLFRSRLGPGAENKIFDKRVTDDRMLIIIDATNKDEKTIESEMQQMKKIGAQEVKIVE